MPARIDADPGRAKATPVAPKPSAAWIAALSATSGIEANPTRTIHALIRQQADLRPSAPALLSDREIFDFATLAQRMNAYAVWARAQGVGRGTTVALLMSNRPDYVAIWLGITLAGGVAALINSNLTGASLAHCITIANPRLLIVEGGLHAAYESAAPHLADDIAGGPRLWSHGESPASLPRIDLMATGVAGDSGIDLPFVSIEDKALLIYTSGTTGLPKAAQVSNRRIMNWALWFKGLLGTDESDRMYDCLPLYHSVGGVVAIASLLAAGGSVVIAPKFSVTGFWADIDRWDCTLFQYIGELCRYLLAGPPDPHETSHHLRLVCGNGLGAGVWQKFQQRFGIPQIVEFYAATEGNFSLYNVEGVPGAIGRIPAFLTHRFPIAIVKHDSGSAAPSRGSSGFCQRVETGEAGEAIGRIGAMNGRFEGYTSTADSDRKILRDVFELGDAWFRTGDLMRVDARGFYYFVDRIGDTFRWKGENVSASEVAGALMDCRNVAEAVVFGVPVPGCEGRAGMALLIVDEGFDLKLFRSEIRGRLPAYAVPLFLRIGQSALLTETFKYKKQDLQREGFDPAATTDSLYVESPAAAAYVAIGGEVHARIMAGEFRL